MQFGRRDIDLKPQYIRRYYPNNKIGYFIYKVYIIVDYY